MRKIKFIVICMVMIFLFVGCGIWHSDGIYYDYGSEKARDVFSLFGLSWDDLD